MATHTATIGLVRVSSVSGAVLTGTDHTIQDALEFVTEPRIIPDGSIPNSAGYPTVKDYISAEDASGFNFVQLGNTFVVTAN